MRFGRFSRALVVASTAFTVLLSDTFARSAPDSDDDREPAAAPANAPPARNAAPSAPANDARAPAVEAAVRALVQNASFKDALVGVSVVDVDSGAVLAERGSHVALNPASNAKLYTAAAALAILHGSHKYQTTLGGTIKSGAIAELVLRGQGDPSLASRDLWAMAKDLKAHGVRKVDSIVVDQRYFDEQTTPPAFEQQPNEWASFRAPVSAVAVDENTISLVVRPTSSGEPATVSFEPPGFVSVQGSVKTGDEGADSVGLELAPAGRKLSAKLFGAIGADARFVRYTRRVDDPQLLAGYALKAIFEEIGVSVGAEPVLATGPVRSRVLLRHESEPVATLLYALGKRSDNFYAEMIFKSLGAEGKSRPGKSQEAAAVVTRWLEKHDLTDAGLVIKNGSGLFDANRTTASAVTKLLRFVYRDPGLRDEFVAQLAIGGVDGTLHKRFRDLRVHRSVRAKTGTLDDAIALSGYILGPPGKGAVAFSILFNKVSGKASAARIAADKLVTTIHESLWR